MLGHDAEEDEENKDTMPEKIMKIGSMLENSKKKDLIRHNAGELGTKRRDRIQARCRGTRNKKGSKMPENRK